VATEASTIGSLRTVTNAQATFATSCGAGFYSPTVAALRMTGTGKSAFIGPEFIANTTTRVGYTIIFAPGTVAAKAPATCNGLAAGTTVQSYFVGADPASAGPGVGTRHFGTSGEGSIYQSTARISAFYTGKPPAPAKPLQ
jgi:hypothetical protein